MSVHLTASAGGVTYPGGTLILLQSSGGVTMTAISNNSAPIPSSTQGLAYVAFITLTGPAPAGANVAVTGSRPNIINIVGYDQNGNINTNSVFIPAGQTTGRIYGEVTPFTGINHGTSVTVTYGGITRTTNESVEQICGPDPNCNEVVAPLSHKRAC